MPMTESQLDMITTMHEVMFWRLNALEMLFKGGQRAVDEFNASGLVGLEKRKANALSKAKRGNPNGGGGGGDRTSSSAKRQLCRSGGWTPFRNRAPTSTHTPGQAFSAPRQQQQQQGVKCCRCNRFNHKTEDCRSG
jgi:hypothetical protein